MSEKKTYRPSLAVFMDILLIINAVFFMMSAGHVVTSRTAVIGAVITNLIVAALWFFLLGPLCTIEVVKGSMSGPSPQLVRETILLRRIDLRRSVEYIPKARMWGYRDIWAHDGTKIRLFRYLLGGRQMYEIMHMIKNYPFREDASATTT